MTASPPARHRRIPVIRVYEPHGSARPPLFSYPGELWRWRHFVLELARSDVRSENYATVLGQVWNLLHPLMMAAIYLLLLTVVRGGEGTTSDHVAKLLLGIFVFRFISQGMTKGASSVVQGSRLVLNSAVPRAVLPISTVLASVILLAPTLGVYLLFHVGLGQPITPALLYLPLMVVLVAIILTGITLALSALTVVFRDTTNILTHSNRYLMYMTPVIYRVEDIPDAVRPIIMANPLTPVFAGLQNIVDGQPPSPEQLAAASVMAAGTLLLGAWYFIRKERGFALAV